MLKAAAVFTIAFMMILASVTAAPAISIFSSGAGDGFGTLTCVSGLVACGPGVAAITTIPGPWQPNNPGGSNAVWVSFDANHGTDGLGPNVASPNALPGNQTVTFNYHFTLATPGTLTFSVFADDTAQVVLDGAFLALGNGTQDAACAAGPIGCQPGEGATFTNIALGTGAHNIDFGVFQRVLLDNGTGTPFGLLFAGDLTPVPEPASILLVGSALAAVGMASRRRWQKKNTPTA